MNAPDDYQQALAQGYLPIREVARSTGVNPVTLRAWERRYGLIVPHRTPKGHRLYSADNVERIQAVLAWLARGVAVSQVKELLEQRTPTASVGSNLWQEQRQALLHSIAQQAERQLDEQFNRALALYPPRTLCQQLLLPLLAELDQRWHGAPFGAQLERVFWHSWLRSKLGARLYHNNRQQAGAALLLVNLSDLPLEPNLWLSAWLASSAECSVEVLDWPVPAAELLLAVEHSAPRALLLYAGQALDNAQLRRELPRLHSACNVPVLLVGHATQIHADELHTLPGLHLARDPLDAEQLLQRLGLLGEPQKDTPCAN
ncbi:MerR family transcriptional regulator [Aquipseudomonas ullengensis]|uniref:MerR family transcriptional regulator n=1 Tax=Aquipseudomonas ullengensis TaxID=2759166 RepID=A0A7W4LK08_9GAMM|nr:MerR family transcriptional regulator [Pseudomonas ullengensis]MBB2494533.1 MerR family transcriptional regulator [Pseudomonas ullengensis]